MYRDAQNFGSIGSTARFGCDVQLLYWNRGVFNPRFHRFHRFHYVFGNENRQIKKRLCRHKSFVNFWGRNPYIEHGRWGDSCQDFGPLYILIMISELWRQDEEEKNRKT